MGCFDKPEPRPKAELPERLLRLDRELATERTKDFETLYAVRGQIRTEVSIFRNGRNGFTATAKFNGRPIRQFGMMPSEAYFATVRALQSEIVKFEVDRQFEMSKNEMSSAA